MGIVSDASSGELGYGHLAILSDCVAHLPHFFLLSVLTTTFCQ